MTLKDSTPDSFAVDLGPSFRDVTYCCGYCKHALNLRSSQRNTENIDSRYKRAIKKGFVSFLEIDKSRFSLAEELSCRPYFSSSTSSWGLLRRRTRLLCCNCGVLVGFAYEKAGANKCYDIRISALHPCSSSADE
ncbi:hypothetical protein HPP92_013446 [Vanilla planifolia]|uniref:Protein yippee-like n=1 Tax=Vanilla planifolia TaxID=51239 RepID=A0A835QYL7_VANPL|nr:hypothetical protein HPP92_013888 [Vanilla planifolia]KAG0478727.1 hypothetical protein HPP92_013446 [Vanilla planifolia]